jgi:hypothetical protein
LKTRKKSIFDKKTITIKHKSSSMLYFLSNVVQEMDLPMLEESVMAHIREQMSGPEIS